MIWNSKIIESLFPSLSRHGYPDEVVTENGPPFKSAWPTVKLRGSCNHWVTLLEQLTLNIKTEKKKYVQVYLMKYRITPHPATKIQV